MVKNHKNNLEIIQNRTDSIKIDEIRVIIITLLIAIIFGIISSSDTINNVLEKSAKPEITKNFELIGKMFIGLIKTSSITLFLPIFYLLSLLWKYHGKEKNFFNKLSEIIFSITILEISFLFIWGITYIISILLIVKGFNHPVFLASINIIEYVIFLGLIFYIVFYKNVESYIKNISLNFNMKKSIIPDWEVLWKETLLYIDKYLPVIKETDFSRAHKISNYKIPGNDFKDFVNKLVKLKYLKENHDYSFSITNEGIKTALELQKHSDERNHNKLILFLTFIIGMGAIAQFASLFDSSSVRNVAFSTIFIIYGIFTMNFLKKNNLN